MDEPSIPRTAVLAKLRSFAFPRPEQWVLRLVQHAVGMDSAELQVDDEGEGADGTPGLAFRYDGAKVSRAEIEAQLDGFTQQPSGTLSPSHLSYALLGATRTPSLLIRLLRGRASAIFFAEAEQQACALSLPEAHLEWGAPTASKWTYRLSLGRDRPLFATSIFAHPELPLLEQACRFSPTRIRVNSAPLLAPPAAVHGGGGLPQRPHRFGGALRGGRRGMEEGRGRGGDSGPLLFGNSARLAAAVGRQSLATDSGGRDPKRRENFASLDASIPSDRNRSSPRM